MNPTVELLAGSVEIASEHMRKLKCPEFTEPIGRVEFVQNIIRVNTEDLLVHKLIQTIVEVLVNPENGLIEYSDVRGLIDRSFVPHA